MMEGDSTAEVHPCGVRDGQPWIKAGKSDPEGNCVEMRRSGERVAFRDSKNADAGILTASPDVFTTWLPAARSGQFDALS